MGINLRTGLANVLSLVFYRQLPSIWDLNLRFADIPFLSDWRVRPRLILDVFRVGSQLTVVQQDQRHYFNQDDQGN
jgi:hypothetical protein